MGSFPLRFPCAARAQVSELHEEFIPGNHAGDVPRVDTVDSTSYEKLLL